MPNGHSCVNKSVKDIVHIVPEFNGAVLAPINLLEIWLANSILVPIPGYEMYGGLAEIYSEHSAQPQYSGDFGINLPCIRDIADSRSIHHIEGLIIQA